MQRITICAGCGAEDGAGPGAEGATALAARLAGEAGLADRVRVATADCLSVCARPVALAVRAPGKAAYLFAGVDPAAQIEEILAFARLYDAAPDGVIADARPCGRLRHQLIGRIPG